MSASPADLIDEATVYAQVLREALPQMLEARQEWHRSDSWES